MPPGCLLAFHEHLGILSLLALDETSHLPRVLAEAQFTANEIHVLLPLLENYPNYSPLEVLHAAFTYGARTEATITRSRLRMQEAQFAGLWDYEMRPLRNIISRTRHKLRDVGIEVVSMVETGYMLVKAPDRFVVSK